MIVRRWGCHTKPGREAAYLDFLQSVMLPHMKQIPGNGGVRVLRQLETSAGRTHIVVVSYWTDMESIRAFTGPEPALAVVPDEARVLLDTYDRSVDHFVVELSDPPLPITAPG